MPVSKQSAMLRAMSNSLQRYHAADDPELIAARRNLAAEQLAEHVERIVSVAPPLTEEQLERVAALLRSGRSA